MTNPAPTRAPGRVRVHLTRARQHIGMFRYSVAHYLAALTLLIVTTPILAAFESAVLVESVVITIVLVSGVVAVGRRRSAMIGSVLLIAPALVGRWLDHLVPGLLPPWVFLGCTILFLFFLLGNLLAYILRAPRVNSEVLCAGIATYLTIGITWGVVYHLVDRLVPGSFSVPPGTPAVGVGQGFTAIYFSFVTLATVGYGDITPATPTARMLAMVEAMVGTFYVAILVARLVSLYSTAKPPEG